jgi:hypothetical protein
MPTAPDQRATRRLGGVILLLGALSFAATAVVPRLDFVRPHVHRFEVPLDRGVDMLEAGSSVRLAGLPVGRVSAANPARSRDGRFDVVAVEIAVDPDIVLGEGTAVQLVAPLLGTGTDVRLLPGDGPPIADGATLPWVPPPDLLESVFGRSHADTLRRIQGDIERLTAWYDDHHEEIASILDAIEADVTEIGNVGRRDVETWSESWTRLQGGIERARAATAPLRTAASALSYAWDRLAAGFKNSAKTFGGVMPAGGGSLDELRMLSAAPDLTPVEARAAAIEATWTLFRPRWAALVSHVGEAAEVARMELPYALANTTLAGNELTGLLDDAETDPLPIAGEALGVLLGLIPGEDGRRAMARADALRSYVRAIMDLKAVIEAIDRVHAISSGSGVAIPADARARLTRALEALLDAERAAVRAWTPAP